MENYDAFFEGSAANVGLAQSEVLESRKKYGENILSRKKRKGFLSSFLESFGDPMIKILLIALAVNIIFLFRHVNWFESIGIAAAILLATLVSTLSEYGSESAFERLQEEASRINCRVRRRDGLSEIAAEQIVVGDIVLLESGDRIPADGTLIFGSLDVDQSPLNGESKEAAKYPLGPASGPDHPKGDFLHPEALFSGSIACSGLGVMRVTEVGDNTIYGRIGAEIQEETRESPLKHRLASLAASIGKFSYGAAAVIALAYFFNVIVLDSGFDMAMIMKTVTSPDVMFGHVIKAATLAVTVIVMAVPEGLPMMTTVVLSSNMRRMLKDNVLVRKLTGIETAGSLSILFTDKTGTLTIGKLEVTHFISGSGKIWPSDRAATVDRRLKNILCDSIYYNCAASTSGGGVIGGNATDRAALTFVSDLGSNTQNIKKGKIVPFSNDAKFMATTVSGAMNATLIKGAPEKILPFCTAFYGENGSVFESFERSMIEDVIEQLANQAVRIIAIAISDSPVDSDRDFKNLRLVGLLGIRDDLRPEAVGGVYQMTRAGIQTVMVTGDSKLTALSIARELGLVRKAGDIVMTSEQLNFLTDDELSHILPDLKVVARALPADKSRLVRVAQKKGLVVGMTGDGVNDAPALKQADVGFSMGSGTEIAKEASDIVILDDNFNSITKAVCYGRTAFKSIRKFIIYQMSICMCAVCVTVIGPLIGVDFPITVIQMLWINIVMDTLAGLAFSGETAQQKYMQEPPKPRDEPIINAYMRKQIAASSIYTTALCLFFLKSPALQRIFGAHGEIYMLTAFFTLFMFSAIFTSFCARTYRVNPLDYLSANKPFLWIMAAVTAIQLIIIYFGGSAFRTVHLELNHLIAIILFASTIIPMDMARKYLSRKTVEYGAI